MIALVPLSESVQGILPRILLNPCFKVLGFNVDLKPLKP